VNEAEVVLGVVLKAGRHAAEVLEPREESFDLPAAAVAAQGPPVLRRRPPPVTAVRGDHLDACSGQLGVERVRVISLVADQSLR
jgi:hypothetical protein